MVVTLFNPSSANKCLRLETSLVHLSSLIKPLLDEAIGEARRRREYKAHTQAQPIALKDEMSSRLGSEVASQAENRLQDLPRPTVSLRARGRQLAGSAARNKKGSLVLISLHCDPSSIGRL